MKASPDQAAQQFFRMLMQSQCNICWDIFTKKSQDVFLAWTKDDIYKRHPKAAQFSKIGEKEIRLMFEKNDTSLMKSFWKHFFFISNAGEMFRYGYFSLVGEPQGSTANVLITMKYPDGRTKEVPLKMFNERGGWRLGYLESDLPF